VRNRTIDFCVGWGPWPDEPFLDLIREHCDLLNLTCVVCRDDNVGSIIRRLESGQMRVAFHLDSTADYEDGADLYGRLGYAVKDGGGYVVNEPDHAKIGVNKAVIHYHFERAGIPVPFTIVVRNWEPSSFRLTISEKKRLGRPFIIKPARGYGKEGVLRVRSGTVKEIRKARRYDRGDDFLIQELVEPEWFGHHMGWFRAFHVFGQVILCWWDTVTEHYSCVTVDEFEQYDFAPLCALIWRIADRTHMNFFSTELAITGKGTRRRVLAIDYVNDPCDMTPQSRSHCGVPDGIVRVIAERLVESAWRVRRGVDPSEPSSVRFGE
jgi:hypothetical protein